MSWHQLVTTDENCPECKTNNVQKDRYDNNILICRRCDFRYMKEKCTACHNTPIRDIIGRKTECKGCGLTISHKSTSIIDTEIIDRDL